MNFVNRDMFRLFLKRICGVAFLFLQRCSGFEASSTLITEWRLVCLCTDEPKTVMGAYVHFKRRLETSQKLSIYWLAYGRTLMSALTTSFACCTFVWHDVHFKTMRFGLITGVQSETDSRHHRSRNVLE